MAVEGHRDASGGGTGIVESVVAGTNVSVDDTDPANPIVSADGDGTAPFSDATAIVKNALDATKLLRFTLGTLAGGTEIQVPVIGPSSFVRHPFDATNIAIGTDNGADMSGGGENIFFGNGAGRYVTTCSYVIGIGAAAVGSNLTTGLNYSIGIGTSALGSLTSGADNIAIGRLAGSGITTGTFNIAIGNSTIATATAAGYVIAIGFEAMKSGAVSTFNYSIGIGYQTLKALTTGTNNIGIGYQACDAITDGADNIGIGNGAAGAGASNSYCVAIGSSALAANTYSGSVAVGYLAGSAFGNSHNAVFIGRQSGENVTSGDYSTFLGAYAGGVSSAAYSRVICVGYSAKASADGQCVFGSDTGYVTEFFMGQGVTATTPRATNINGTGGTGSNAAAANLFVAGGKSTGTGAGGNTGFKTSPSGSSGSSANSLVDRMTVVAKGKALTDGVATSLFEIALPAGSMAGGKIISTIVCSDGTDFQSVTQETTFAAVNKAGAYTKDVDVIGISSALSAGTLTNTPSLLDGTDKVTMQFTADSSLTPTRLDVYYQVINNSEQAITVL